MDSSDFCQNPEINAAQVSQTKAALISETAAFQIAQIFKALSDPTRVRLIAALAQCELCVYDLAAILDMSHSAISHQLGLLRQLGLVRFRKAGRHVYYALADSHIETLFSQTLDHIQHQ